MATTEPNSRESHRSPIRLPRPLWFGLVTGVLAVAYGALYWHNLHTGPFLVHGQTGIKYLLDYDRGIAHARLWNKPVLVFFTGVNCANSRRMEKNVLNAPAVVERLRKFVCVESFVDNVPLLCVADRTEAARLLSQNVKLQEESFGDVTLPAFVAVRHFLSPDVGLREPIAQTSGLIDDEATFVRFLDEALEKWSKSSSSP